MDKIPEMIERAARALAARMGDDPDLRVIVWRTPLPVTHGGYQYAPSEGMIGPLWHAYIDQAQLVIRVIDKMLKDE
jgi:hypothetical protein